MRSPAGPTRRRQSAQADTEAGRQVERLLTERGYRQFGGVQELVIRKSLMQEERHYYRPDEIAERFQVSLSYVYFLIRKKKIRSVKIGRLHRIPRREYCRMCRGSNGCLTCIFSKNKELSDMGSY